MCLIGQDSVGSITCTYNDNPSNHLSTECRAEAEAATNSLQNDDQKVDILKLYDNSLAFEKKRNQRKRKFQSIPAYDAKNMMSLSNDDADVDQENEDKNKRGSKQHQFNPRVLS
jgi:hypothetical protein